MYPDLRANDNLKEKLYIAKLKNLLYYVINLNNLPIKMSLNKYEQYCFAVARFCGLRSQG